MTCMTQAAFEKSLEIYNSCSAAPQQQVCRTRSMQAAIDAEQQRKREEARILWFAVGAVAGAMGVYVRFWLAAQGRSLLERAPD